MVARVVCVAFGGVVLAAVAGCSSAPDSRSDDVITRDGAYLSYDNGEALAGAAELVVEGVVVSSEVREIPLTSGSDSTDPHANPALGATTTTVEMPPTTYTVATIKVERVRQGDAQVGSLVEVKQLGGHPWRHNRGSAQCGGAGRGEHVRRVSQDRWRRSVEPSEPVASGLRRSRSWGVRSRRGRRCGRTRGRRGVVVRPLTVPSPRRLFDQVSPPSERCLPHTHWYLRGSASCLITEV